MEGRPLDETESGLVERARRGDIRAYEELVRRYQDVAFRLAYTILGSAEEAEDAAQEGSSAPTTRLTDFAVAPRCGPGS